MYGNQPDRKEPLLLHQRILCDTQGVWIAENDAGVRAMDLYLRHIIRDRSLRDRLGTKDLPIRAIVVEEPHDRAARHSYNGPSDRLPSWERQVCDLERVLPANLQENPQSVKGSFSLRCTQHHLLNPLPRPDAKCNFCNNELPQQLQRRDSNSFACKECDFDVCFACYEKHSAVTDFS